MKNSHLKIVSLTAISAVLATSLFAGIEERLDTLEKEMQEISTRTPQDTLGVTFVSAQPEIKDSPWFATFDVIYWHTKMGGTEYAYSINKFRGPGPIPIDGDTKDNDFGWDLGLKVGLGYKLSDHDQWDVYARYTWFETTDSDNSTKPSPSALVSLTWFDQVIASRAKSHIDINYNNLEVEVGRSYFSSGQLSFRPHFDVKSTWIDINHDVVLTASGLDPDLDPLLVGMDFKTKEHLLFWGFGPRAGVDSKWFLGYGFHIFGEVAASILYSHFKTTQKDLFPPSAFGDLNDGRAFNVKHKFHRMVPFAQMFLGLGWDTYVNDEKQHLGFKLGYEVHYYWRVNQIHQPEDLTLSGDIATTPLRIQFEKQSEDLMFYGITGEFRIDF
ncbi:MAG: hypothetical protein K1060chlam2_01227 [Chlamydiae bacterium]|nr:hypothetical protein [Chlamydiota bacterium]